MTYQKEAYRYKNGDSLPICLPYWASRLLQMRINAGKWIDWVDEVSGNTATNTKVQPFGKQRNGKDKDIRFDL